MLTELRIRNFAIIESLTLPLSPGFNALSGETGAGKSIIVGALGMLLGERGTGEVVRTGSERATVEGVFDISDRPEIAAALDERGIEIEDDTVIFRREISANGRSRAWANGARRSFFMGVRWTSQSESFESHSAKPSWCLLVMTTYFIPASRASFAHSAGSYSVGLNCCASGS